MSHSHQKHLSKSAKNSSYHTALTLYHAIKIPIPWWWDCYISESTGRLPRWNVVHDFMNCSWTFMNVHEQFMKSSSNTRIVGSWTKVHEQFTITVHELFKNLLWKKIVHEQFINSSWKVHINKRSWTVHHQFMNCSRTYYEPKNSSWTVHKQFVES